MLRIVRCCLLAALLAGVETAVASYAHGSASGIEPTPQVLSVERGSSQSPESAAEIFRQGKLAMQSGDLSNAEDDFRRVIVLDPKSAPAHINLGVVLMRQKRWDDALKELGIAKSLAPGEPGIQLNIGLAHYRKNDFSAAIEPFSSALRLAPGSSQARYLLGLCYFFTNHFEETATTLQPLWDQESTHLNYLYVLSIAAGKSSHIALQKQASDQMLAVGQSMPEFHLYLGKAWLAQDDTAKALEEFHAAVAAKPDLPLAHYFLGRTHLERHEYTEAESELRQDAAIEPDFAYNYEDLGILYVLLNRPQEAERNFRLAAEHNSSLVNSWFGLAKLYRDQGRFQDSLTMLDRAEPLAPTSASVHFTRGQVLKSLGQTDRSRQELETAAKLLKSFNDRLQTDQSDDRVADAQEAAQQ